MKFFVYIMEIINKFIKQLQYLERYNFKNHSFIATVSRGKLLSGTDPCVISSLDIMVKMNIPKNP